MGTVHKFKRPPKNRKQFEGYAPRLRQEHIKAPHGRPWVAGWRASALAWAALLLLAVGIWAAGALLGSG